MKTPEQDSSITPKTLAEQCTNTPRGRAIRLLGDTWVLLIVMCLLAGPQRFNVLRAALGHISSKTLSQRLKLLEELGFVRRDAFLEIPPRVEYRLTEKGQELGSVIDALDQFGLKHLSDAEVASLERCAAVAEALAPAEDDE